MKKNIIAIATGFLIWFFLSSFYPKLVSLVLQKSFTYKLSILWGYILLISFVSAFFVGWIGKSRGYVLGLITQFLITLFLIFFFKLDMFMNELKKEGMINVTGSLLKYIGGQMPGFIFASIGGYLGEKMRKKEKVEDNSELLSDSKD